MLGLVVPHVTGPVRRYYNLEARRLSRMQESLGSARQLRAVTSDGHAIGVLANVASAQEVRGAVAGGADGVGLFRTEMLFMDREQPPSEDEQYEAYSTALRAASGRPVTIRLLDVGGDKPLPYLELPDESNPFLGYRGVRLYDKHAVLVRTQLRAILRASGAGEARILVPMVATVEEARAVKETLAQVRNELVAEGVRFERMPKLGAMVEVPSAAFMIEELSREVDFFSVGSNDLAQYFLAADRDNRSVSSIYGWSHPSFLRLLKKVVDDAQAAGRTVSLCGEMADSSAAVPLLLALGFDELSLAAPRVVNVKRAVASSRLSSCAELLERAMGSATRVEVEALVGAFTANGGDHQPLLLPELMIGSEAATMAEVIKELTDAIWLAGRVARPHLLEEKVWLREEVYSTGFGYGFAIPHCKSDQLTASSIAVARLLRPVEWGLGAETKPVDVVMLLALREQDHGNEHMRIFAKLSRLVMHDDFRNRIRAERDPQRLLTFFEESLGLRAAVA
jgi:fructose-specific PTS system IIA-like component